MKVVHIISLIGRLALMAAMVLGLMIWIMQISVISVHVNSMVEIIFRDVHQLLGAIGAILLLALGAVVIFSPGTRWLAAAGILYAFIFPAFGLVQASIFVGNLHWLVQIVHLLLGIGAMYLAREIERRHIRRGREVASGAAPAREAASF
ncbi:hypothetical protein [Dictyobacter formicarum]|uniref:DUF4383 domain-containing protein n=1 Tax=Dictyobacter formicarum TaxID=2778368 RepID=A0ABQ3VIM7_9CHLR|nr:hypothetical protein [Dictyobacter formicarum]GHO85678.1 hypothetical protein KSZ_36840 [Dictyobacter formicarum]